MDEDEDMPLYEYQCEACGHRFEKIQKFSDPPLEACPSCGGAVRKLISSPAIQFKGSGWYVTDYARGGTEGAATESKAASDTKGEASPSSDKAGAKATSGESKPADKTAPDKPTT